MAAPVAERARGLLARLRAAVALPEEDGEIPARLLAEHLVGSRRRMKLLLTQLRVLRLLLGVLEAPAPPPAAPSLRPAAVAEARSRWRELKGGYGGVVGALGGAVPPTLSQLGRGRGLLRRIRRAVRPPRAALSAEVQRRRSRVVALRERAAALRGQTEERRRALRAHREAASRGGARCRLLQALSGLRLLPGPEVELGPPPGASDPPPALRVRGGPDGELSVVGGPPPLPPPLCPGLLELQSQLWAWGPLWGEVRALQSRFALDWEPQCGRVRVLGGGPGVVWTLQLEGGYPQPGGAVRVVPPPGKEPPNPPSEVPTLTQWVELLVGTPP